MNNQSSIVYVSPLPNNDFEFVAYQGNKKIIRITNISYKPKNPPDTKASVTVNREALPFNLSKMH